MRTSELFHSTTKADRLIRNNVNTYATHTSQIISAPARLVAGAILAFLLTTASFAADDIKGDAAAGKSKAATCAACHGADGNSVNPQWPSLAGQHASYIAATLYAFRDGTRSDVLMSSQATILSEQDIADLAAYFAQQKATRRTADPKLVKLGERLYRGGDKNAQVSACIACHGPTGRGNAPAGYPSIAGQHATYTAKQLSDYKAKRRTSDGDTQMMRNITARLARKVYCRP